MPAAMKLDIIVIIANNIVHPSFFRLVEIADHRVVCNAMSVIGIIADFDVRFVNNNLSSILILCSFFAT